MERFIYDESNGLWYELVGDYYLPCLLSPENKKEIGIWGQKHFEFIKQYKKSFYATLLMSDKLNDYLANIDQQANELYDMLIKQLAEKENIAEKLKEENQMLWMQKMNNISQIAKYTVSAELIFV